MGFKGSLDDVGEAVVPHELRNMILWMLKVKGVHIVKTEARMHALLRSASFIYRQIMLTHISDRQELYMPKPVDAPGFRSTVETPLTLGMAQYCNQWRSHKLAEILSTPGVGIPYRVKQCVTQTAEGVQQNIEEHAVNNAQSCLHWYTHLRIRICFMRQQCQCTIDNLRWMIGYT